MPCRNQGYIVPGGAAYRSAADTGRQPDRAGASGSQYQNAHGFDVADNEIVKRVGAGDLVITSDIPLAAEVIEKGGFALSPRGELYSTDNIRARLNMRDFMDTLRSSGVDTGGPPALNQGDRQAFANHLDKFLTRHASDR